MEILTTPQHPHTDANHTFSVGTRILAANQYPHTDANHAYLV